MTSDKPMHVASETGDIAVKRHRSGVAVLEICRPPNNFFDVQLIGDLAELLHALDTDDDIRSVVLASRGKHFCAGADHSGAGGAARRIRGDEAFKMG